MANRLNTVRITLCITTKFIETLMYNSFTNVRSRSFLPERFIICKYNLYSKNRLKPQYRGIIIKRIV